MRRYVVLSILLLGLDGAAGAAVINVGPSDSYTKIEAAKAGDTVVIAPGTYKFRVMLSQQGSAAQPIVIKAQDPGNRPVWDLAGKSVSDWPGSYTAGDKGRGCWQVKGSHYQISGVVFRNCQDSSSAGIRAVNSGPLTVRDCLFENNTNGITGSAQGFVVEFSEFRQNGKLSSSGSPTHNIYIYGGVFTLRYSYLHDPLEGQNIHIRARSATIEYNWLSRAASYPADLMSCNYQCGGSGTGPITQKMLLRGNIIVQHSGGANLSQFVAMSNDEPGGSSDSTGAVSDMELTLIHNTVVGVQLAAGKTQRLVNMRNDGVGTKVTLHNNIVYQVKELAVAHDPQTSNWSVSGGNNWVSTGTPTTNLTGSVVGASPGFANAAAKDYRTTATSPCVGQAVAVTGLPDKEYYLDETVTMQYRPRATAGDIGAYEQGNSAAPVGPYGQPPPPPDGGVPDLASTDAAAGDGMTALDAAKTGDGAPLDGVSGADAAGSDGRTSGDDGCSCALASRPTGGGALLPGALLLLALWRRPQREE